jgi:hypothetical protein
MFGLIEELVDVGKRVYGGETFVLPNPLARSDMPEKIAFHNGKGEEDAYDSKKKKHSNKSIIAPSNN